MISHAQGQRSINYVLQSASIAKEYLALIRIQIIIRFIDT